MLLLEHLQRVKDGARDVYHLRNLSPWIEKNIYLEGKLMSMSDAYKFQADIVDDTARVNNVVKCAQIGLTTATIAYFLAGLATQRKFNVIYALPTASDAAKLTTTKVNPLIYNSPRLRQILNKDVDSVELKQLGDNFLFTRGSKSETAALSISADCLVADEIDRCDPEVLKQFRSRLQASQLGIIRQFSTPTIAGVGISKEAETSKRYRSMATCACCGHKWLPTYDLDILVPDCDIPLLELTRHNIKDVRWQDARWNCPKCGRDPVLDAHKLEWVCENPLDNFEANTYYVNPVTCCEVLRPSYLVRTSTEYNNKAEWRNQVLGETAEDTNEQLTESDVKRALVHADLSSSEVHYMGVDMGLVCTFTIGRLTSADELIIVHRENVSISKFTERRNELIVKYRCVVSVHDAYPYTSEIMRVCDFDPNAYGCIFTTTKAKSVEIFTVQMKEEDTEEGRLNLRLVKANRTRGLDELLLMFKEGRVIIQQQDPSLDSQYMAHALSMKRSQVFINDELVYQWQKTNGEDHFFFSTLYMYLACRLRGTVESRSSVMALVSKFRIKQKKA